MNSLTKNERIIQFNGISKSRFKGHKVCVEVFFHKLLIKFPNHEEHNVIYSFDSLEQLKMERKQSIKQDDVINISISYPENRNKFESIIVSSEDAISIIDSFNYYKKKSQGADRERVDFEHIMDVGRVTQIEFDQQHDVRNYNNGRLYLSSKELKFNSFNGKDFIIHLDQNEESFYYEVVILETDILGYSKWVSIYRLSDYGKERLEMVNFVTNNEQASLLEQLFSEHYESFLEERMQSMQTEWAAFVSGVEEEYQVLMANEESIKLSYEFIDKTHNKVFLEKDALFEFELLLKRINASKRARAASQKDEEIEISPGVVDFFENSFFDFVKLLSSKLSFKDGDTAVFATWRLLKTLVIQYYHDFFKKNYASYFENMKNLNEYINAYSRIEKIDIESDENIAIFTYFLMKSYWQNEDNFLYYFNTISDELQSKKGIRVAKSNADMD